MRFKVDIGGTTMLLTDKQLARLLVIIESSERIEDKYVGNNKGPNGTAYLKLIRPYVPADHFRVNVMSDSEYETMKLVTKLEDEKQ